MNKVQVLSIDASEVPGLWPVDSRASRQLCITRMPTLSSGLNALQDSRFHLVLLSLSLRDASEDESVRETLRKARHLPVVAVVNAGETAKAARALRLGVDDYIVKGCHYDVFSESIRHAIERKRLVADANEAGPHITNAGAQLTAHLSHELRNALACIHQFGTIIIDGLAGTVSEEQREYLCIMLENASTIRTVLDTALEGTFARGCE